MPNRPRIFIGSSTEALPAAGAVNAYFSRKGQTRLWNQGVFGLGRGNLENLIAAAESVDFAILVLTADDTVQSRGIDQPGPRDNVLFELGLFMGKLGRDRTFIVADRSKPPKIPSDLAGIMYVDFEPDKENIRASVAAACFDIEQEIDRRGCRDLGVDLPDSIFEPVNEDWFTTYSFTYDGKLWDKSPSQISLTNGLSLFWLAHDLLWTSIVLLTNQEPNQVRRGLTQAAWQMEQSGLSNLGTYFSLKSYAEKGDSTEFWTRERRRTLSTELVRATHTIGESLNGHFFQRGPRGYLPMPPRPENEVTLKAFFQAPLVEGLRPFWETPSDKASPA
jgi:hypothetical protein